MFSYSEYLTDTNPDKLVIFLYGHNSVADDYHHVIELLQQELISAALLVPDAPEISDTNPQKRQWFGIQRHDPENRRTVPETSVEDIFAVYNKTAADIDDCAAKVNNFIDEMQQKYKLSDAKTYLIGFSQGAMLAIYTALTRRKNLAATFSLSGLIAGADLLHKHQASHPVIHLLHGENDMKVQYKTMPYSQKWLQEHNIDCKTVSYPELSHRINIAEVNYIAAIINN